MAGFIERLMAASAFRRSVAVLVGGNVAAMALPIIAAPILGRIYPPHDYAALAQYMAVSAVLAVLATMQFQHAIIAEKSTRAARQIVWLCCACSLLVAVLVLGGVVLGWQLGLSDTSAGGWFWLLPFSLCTSGVVAGGTALANRLGKFRWMASLPVLQTVTTVVLSIVLGLMGWGSDGLLTAYFAGQAMQVFAFAFYLGHAGVWTQRPARALLALYARRHWRFPAYSLPSEFSGQINMQMPVFALTAIGADASLGAFTRARQLVSMPVTALGSAVATVFRRDAAELYRKTGSCRPLMLRTALGLLAVGILPCALFIWAAPWLFTVYLGPAWREAGELASILAPMLLLRVITSPLTSVLLFTENQKLSLQLSMASALIIAVAIGAAWLGGGSAQSIVTGFSIGYGVIYSIYFASCLRVGIK